MEIYAIVEKEFHRISQWIIHLKPKGKSYVKDIQILAVINVIENLFTMKSYITTHKIIKCFQ